MKITTFKVRNLCLWYISVSYTWRHKKFIVFHEWLKPICFNIDQKRHQPVFTMVEWKGWNSYKYTHVSCTCTCIADKFKIKCWYIPGICISFPFHIHFNPHTSDWQVVLPCGWWQLPEYWPAGETPTDLQPHPTLVPRQAQPESPSGNTEQE